MRGEHPHVGGGLRVGPKRFQVPRLTVHSVHSLCLDGKAPFAGGGEAVGDVGGQECRAALPQCLGQPTPSLQGADGSGRVGCRALGCWAMLGSAFSLQGTAGTWSQLPGPRPNGAAEVF